MAVIDHMFAQLRPADITAVRQGNGILARFEIGHQIIINAIGKPEHIVAVAPGQGVIAKAAIEQVIPGTTGQRIIAIAAQQRIVASPANHIFKPGNRIIAGTATAGGSCRKVNRNRANGAAHIEGIGAGLTV